MINILLNFYLLGNDLSKDEVLKELGDYNEYYGGYHRGLWRKKRYFYPGLGWEDFNVC